MIKNSKSMTSLKIKGILFNTANLIISYTLHTVFSLPVPIFLKKIKTK